MIKLTDSYREMEVMVQNADSMANAHEVLKSARLYGRELTKKNVSNFTSDDVRKIEDLITDLDIMVGVLWRIIKVKFSI